MPYAPGKICGNPLCHVRVAHGVSYCEEHEAEWQEKRKLRDRTRKRPQYLDPALLGRWRKVRKEYLQYHPACSDCGRMATVVDHIVPHRGNEDLMFDMGNFQALCKSCHGRKTARDDGGFGNSRRVDGIGRNQS